MEKGSFQHDQYNLQVRPLEEAEKPQWQLLMSQHHYLGHSQLGGEQIYYVAQLDGSWCGLLAWGSGARKSAIRDQWLKWNPEQKYERLKYVINNWRFLILPEFHIKNLASAILSLNMRRISHDWQKKYKHPVLLAETFVDPSKFIGHSYKACGWQALGLSKGFAKTHRGYHYHGQPKIMFVKPIHSHCKKI